MKIKKIVFVNGAYDLPTQLGYIINLIPFDKFESVNIVKIDEFPGDNRYLVVIEAKL